MNRRTFYRSFNENTSFFIISVHFHSFFLISVHFHSFFLISVHFHIIFTVSVRLFICSPFLNRFFLHLVHSTWCNLIFFLIHFFYLHIFINFPQELSARDALRLSTNHKRNVFLFFHYFPFINSIKSVHLFTKNSKTQ